MYHSVGIASLSPAQLSRLRNGHKVRIKIGSSHKIHLSQEQSKKLNSAHKKGKAYTILFDPFQIEKHKAGIFGDISVKGRKSGKGVVSDVLHTAGNVSKSIGLGVARKHAAPKKRNTKKSGKGLFGDLGNIAKSGVAAIAQKGIETGANYLNDKVNSIGGALKNRGIAGRRNKKKSRGGALYPAGYTP
jgi:hypothetical protein